MTYQKDESRCRTWGTTTASRDNRTSNLIIQSKPKKHKLSAKQRALIALAKKLPDRHRDVHCFVGGILLIDDGGGSDILSFDDATALHYLLAWLRRERAALRSKTKAIEDANKRRSAFKLVEVRNDL